MPVFNRFREWDILPQIKSAPPYPQVAHRWRTLNPPIYTKICLIYLFKIKGLRMRNDAERKNRGGTPYPQAKTGKQANLIQNLIQSTEDTFGYVGRG